MVEQKVGKPDLEDLWKLSHDLKMEFKLVDRGDHQKTQGALGWHLKENR